MSEHRHSAEICTIEQPLECSSEDHGRDSDTEERRREYKSRRKVLMQSSQLLFLPSSSSSFVLLLLLFIHLFLLFVYVPVPQRSRLEVGGRCE